MVGSSDTGRCIACRLADHSRRAAGPALCALEHRDRPKLAFAQRCVVRDRYKHPSEHAAHGDPRCPIPPTPIQWPAGRADRQGLAALRAPIRVRESAAGSGTARVGCDSPLGALPDECHRVPHVRHCRGRLGRSRRRRQRGAHRRRRPARRWACALSERRDRQGSGIPDQRPRTEGRVRPMRSVDADRVEVYAGANFAGHADCGLQPPPPFEAASLPLPAAAPGPGPGRGASADAGTDRACARCAPRGRDQGRA